MYSQPSERSSGVICDQTIAFNGFDAAKHYPEHLRRVRFEDPKSGKTLGFLTNNTLLPALSAAALYKNRSLVELFFIRTKQHLRIEIFPGISENAVKRQIWCACAPACSSPSSSSSSRRSFNSMPRDTRCYRFSPTRFSRNPRCEAPCDPIWSLRESRPTLTRWVCSPFNRTLLSTD